ncbi:MAG TPA: Uma2 family endonuclease [Acidimicrobiales bacterium]|jgi:Uma2 family endonuclease|nr:Uma2 family endonuclease [Acidimicrobiales bacterium]
MAHPTRPFTYEDLEGMPDDGYRREIIGGSLIVTPARAGGHQRVAGKLYASLQAAETVETMAMVAPYDWKLFDGGSVQPDVMVIRRPDFDPSGPLPASAVPLLVVEVLSRSNSAQDRILKRDLYQRLGVPAYWLVEPCEPVLMSLRLADGRYEVEAETSGVFRTDWPFPIEIAIAELAR